MRGATTFAAHFSLLGSEKVNMFSNGAGKVLMLHLLTLLLLKVNIRVATTSDPRHDWCGINLPPISGVVDVTLFHGGRHHMLGEVKADSATGTTQVLARRWLPTLGNGHTVSTFL